MVRIIPMAEQEVGHGSSDARSGCNRRAGPDIQYDLEIIRKMN